MTRGRKRYPWIKLWFEDLSSPVARQLSLEEKGCWWALHILAGKCPVRGKLLLTSTKPMTIDQIAAALSLSDGEKPILESVIDKMVYMDELAWVDDCLVITNWRAKQDVYPSDLSPKSETDDADLIYSELTPDELPNHSELTPDELPLDDRCKMIDDRNTPKGARKRASLDPVIAAEIFKDMKMYLGYPEKTDKDPIPSYGKEGQAIKRMLARGFTSEDILSLWKSKVDQSGGEFVSMTWVNEDIGKKVSGGKRVAGGRGREDFRGPW